MDRRTMEKNYILYILWTDDGLPAGYISAAPEHVSFLDTNKKTNYLHNVFVLPHYRKFSVVLPFLREVLSKHPGEWEGFVSEGKTRQEHFWDCVAKRLGYQAIKLPKDTYMDGYEGYVYTYKKFSS
jgi:hypothetical protein